MKYLIITNDEKTVEEVIGGLKENNLNAECHRKGNSYTFTIDEIQDIDAIVVEPNDVKTIADAFPLESFHVVMITAANDTPNPFSAALQSGEIKMPVSKNCVTGHQYDQTKSPLPLKGFIQFLISYKNQHNSVNHIIKDSIKNNILKQGAFANTVVVKDQNQEEQSVSSDVFSDVVMSDPKTFKNIVASYLGRNPIV